MASITIRILDDDVKQRLRVQAAQDGAFTYLTTIKETELLHGVALLPAGKRQTAFAKAIDGILNEEFRGRILPGSR
jgi:plasmid stability protein